MIQSTKVLLRERTIVLSEIEQELSKKLHRAKYYGEPIPYLESWLSELIEQIDDLDI